MHETFAGGGGGALDQETIDYILVLRITIQIPLIGVEVHLRKQHGVYFTTP